MDTNRPIRIGAVSYLNTEPLIHQLGQQFEEAGLAECELTLDVPSHLATLLASGQLDVALIPLVSFLRTPNYQLVSDACIACRGPVWSVKLLSRVPAEQIRSLAVDAGSATSVVLAQVLLARRWKISPRLEPFPLDQPIEQMTTDAVLVIGDRAMQPVPDGFGTEWDLGDVWCRWSELPFVFAAWVARPGVDAAVCAPPLAAARDQGLRQLRQVAASAGPRHGIPVDDCYRYFSKNLHFRLGARECQGIDLFCRHASELGLVPVGQESRIHDDYRIAHS